jgi:ATP-dependent Lon protease
MSQSPLRGGAAAPSSPFPLLPLRTGVLFPGTVLTLPVGRERSIRLLQSVHPGDVLGVVAQRDPKAENPTSADLHAIGTFARVAEIHRMSGGDYRLTLEGLDRFALAELVRSEPYWLAEGEKLDEEVSDEPEADALATELRARIIAASAGGGALARVAASDAEPGVFADQAAAALGLSGDQELELLATLDVVVRLRKVLSLLDRAKAQAEVKKKIEHDVQREIGKGQREAILREQLKAIQRELGDDRAADGLEKLKAKLDAAGLSEEAREAADRELRRLEGMNAQSPEAQIARTYLELIAELPWSARAEAKDDLREVERKLNEDHYGLDDVKKRILEHMAVLGLTGKTRGTILCLAGPPGVGKTSLGQSIADATGRPLVRVSLGGVGDEAELRGHRRTYVGALPGRILSALKKAKVKNPLVLLDEVDKLGRGWRGSPEAALLEILDPEQNATFTDHYLELPFDLSEVLFVCTANDLGALSAPLRDRLEILEISGYTQDEKAHIARAHLLPKQLREHALPEGALTVTDGAIATMLRDYTRESGVRQLSRELGKLCRGVALEVARAKDGKPPRVVVDAADVATWLGKPRFFSEVAERTSVPGVATGLAWTPVGGDILFIETSRMPGKGRLEITGQLGDVMKESAKAALTYVRSHAAELGIQAGTGMGSGGDALEGWDLHIHVPAGAVPKDGPSAGVTMFTALASLLSDRRVRPDTAMTGECTLRGRVLPVGGIKAKVLAAHRAGIRRVILPKKNQRDLDDVPKEVRDELELVLAEDMREVLAAALEATTGPRDAGGAPVKADPEAGSRAQA